jgi:lambda repressor-like predicted transcriptional regulator
MASSDTAGALCQIKSSLEQIIADAVGVARQLPGAPWDVRYNQRRDGPK